MQFVRFEACPHWRHFLKDIAHFAEGLKKMLVPLYKESEILHLFAAPVRRKLSMLFCERNDVSNTGTNMPIESGRKHRQRMLFVGIN